jgi:hypothetical protein
MEKLFLERIKENKNLFTKMELTFLYNNVNIFKKIYLLGLLDNNAK